MKPENLRLIAEQLKITAEAISKIALLLSNEGNHAGQLELPLTTTVVSPAAVVDEPIEHTEGYLASKRKLVEVAPDPKPEITRQSLRALAEKLVAKGKLDSVKTELSKHGVTTLSALKIEGYEAVNAAFVALLQ